MAEPSDLHHARQNSVYPRTRLSKTHAWLVKPTGSCLLPNAIFQTQDAVSFPLFCFFFPLDASQRLVKDLIPNQKLIPIIHHGALLRASLKG